MPALLIDLDNTLIDRSAAFGRWAAAYAQALGGDDGDVRWLKEADKDGYEDRGRLAELVRTHFRLAHDSLDAVLEEMRLGLVENIHLDPGVPDALDAAIAAGWSPVVVTNGTVAQQERKLYSTGLDQHVSGWVISESEGVRKPERAMFEAALHKADGDADDAWMIGDNPQDDILGTQDLGLRTVWLRRGRTWPVPDVTPTLVADSCSQAILLVVHAGTADV